MTKTAAALVLSAALLGGACHTAPSTPDAGCVPGSRGKPSQVVFGGDRPVTLSVPKAYDSSCPAPLVLVLHGYGASGLLEESYLGLDGLVDGRGVLLAAPDGTKDSSGSAFWNPGTASCCNFFGSSVDDVAWLTGLIREIRGVYAVDPGRIYVVGHSNGGFMAHRLACVASADIAAIVSLAGTMDQTPAPCTLSAPVSVLQVHGDADTTVLYDGGTAILGKSGPYASAPDSVRFWAGQDGCQLTQTQGAAFDLDSSLPGDETVPTSFDGCPPGVDVSLWTIQGGSHIPTVGARFPWLAWRWLDAHRRP